jgi:hypothetical protein
VCTGSRESEGPYARRIGTQRIGAAGGDLRERKTRHESVPHGSCCAPVFAYRRYEWCGQMDKVSAPLPKAITFSCVRVPASKAAPSFLVWPALPVQAAGVWHCTESVRLQSLERRGDLHPTRDARAQARRHGGAAVLARRGRGMCSASATAPAAALSSEELIRMERDCSAHKYVSSPPPPYPVSLLPPSIPSARAPHARWNAYVAPVLTRSCYTIT